MLNLICWIGMKNNMAGHDYQGLHGCRIVNESLKTISAQIQIIKLIQ